MGEPVDNSSRYTDILPVPIQGSVLDELSGEGDSWLIVDHTIGSSLFSTHYLCRSCGADLKELRVHHVRWCPYCGLEMSFLLDGQDRSHATIDGNWPYEVFRQRFPSWCGWHSTGDKPRVPTESGGWTQEMTVCRLLEGHDGPHEFLTGRERPPRNPLRGIA